jgi:5,10-methylene-tetrahydrofolate dehydrogenase/methenyl tetrahydrofolate cyclohydrolase
MTAQIIDGKLLAQQIRESVESDVRAMVVAGFPRPGLATILVGENPASHVYISMKHKACEQVGIESFGYVLPDNASQHEVESLVSELNSNTRVNGILVQLPLPSGLDEERILTTINLNKDVDGLNPINFGRLAQKGRDPLFTPCTPSGVISMLDHVGAQLDGVNAVVLGRSNIVGMPVALLLVRRNATVTICHTHTQNLPKAVRQGDVVIAAIGRAETVRGDWVKPGAIVIDVGTNRVEDATKKSGYRLVGDVAYEEVKEVAGAISPVPGGVGPMTIAMLLKNTVRAAKLSDI